MKVRGKKSFLILKALTAAVALGYLFSVLSWYLSAQVWWPFGILPIAYFYLAILLALLIVWWLLLSRKRAIFLTLIFLAGFQPFTATFSFGKSKEFQIEKAPGGLRVMQWNVMGFPGAGKWWDSSKNIRVRAMDFITAYSPDIICIQDFSESKSRYLFSNISFFKDTLHYPYLHVVEYAHTISINEIQHHSTVIVSKIPFIQTGSIPYKSGPYPEHIIWADVNFMGKNLRVISTHFRSFHLFSHKTYNPKMFPYHSKPDSGLIMSPGIFGKLKYFQGLHAGQAEILRAFIDTCTIPVLLAADLNSVPASNVYRRVKGDLTDGFRNNEPGVGASYNYLLPNLRIDFLLNDKQLISIQWKHFEDGFFDHDHILADFKWREP